MPQQAISTSADYATSVYATDLDGDGDADVLSASLYDDKIAWYENLGGGSFGTQQVISTAMGATSVYATDLDGDGDADVLSASMYDDKIVWYEKCGKGIERCCWVAHRGFKIPIRDPRKFHPCGTDYLIDGSALLFDYVE